MILGHCHLIPGGLADKRDEFGVAGTAEHLFGFMRACGFEQAQAIAPFECPAVTTAQARIDGDGLAWLLGQPHVGVKADAPLLPTATISPAAPDAMDKLRRARGRGVRMLKLHPLVMGCNVLDAACEPFFAAAESARMPITYHTGSREGWGQTSDCVSPAACAELAGRHPGLPILMAHCGTFGGEAGFEDAVAACEAHANLYLEATGALGPVGEDAWRGAVARVGPGRIIYGRDYPWTSREMIADDIAFLGRVGLDAAGKRLVLGDNLKRLWQAATPSSEQA
ncbi:MAG TPA: amidohydrolase family protein [Phycisphaerae bacterium]|nr:amidohydrolase family protein [Phycisphaerae bacterium]